MKIQPISSPHAIQQVQTTNNSAARAKAIAAFTQPTAGQAQEHPVANPNQVSVEEMSAISTQTPETSDKLASSEEVEETTTQTGEETTTPVVEEKPEQDPALSQQFAKLARQERQMRIQAKQREQVLVAREQELKAKEQAISSKEQEYSSGYISKDQLRTDTLRILADNGVSYDELTQQLLNQQAVDPRTEATIKRLEAKIANLEEADKRASKTYEEQQQAQYKAAIKQIDMDVRSLVKSDPNFETIKATGSSQDVVDLIEQTYNKDGILLTVEEAALEVENYLIEEALKVTSIGKIKKRLEQNSTAAKAVAQTPTKTQQTQTTMKTLTNAASSTRKLSARERALLAFKGQKF